MRSLVITLIGCSLFTLAGCGNPSGPACSPTFAVCGGNLVGTWQIEGACNVNSLLPMTTCAGETDSVDLKSLSGTYTFNSDNTFTQTESIDLVESATVPASCITTGATSCSAGNATSTTNGVTTTATCTGTVSTGCTCTLTISGTQTVTGTYAKEGDYFTPTENGAAGSQEGYCVSGSQLEVSGGMSGGAMANAYIQLSKQ